MLARPGPGRMPHDSTVPVADVHDVIVGGAAFGVSRHEGWGKASC